MNEFIFYANYNSWYVQAIVENAESYLYINVDLVNSKISYGNNKLDISIPVDDIKRVIESHRLVSLNGGLNQSIEIYEENERSQYIKYDLYDAILDVKECLKLIKSV